MLHSGVLVDGAASSASGSIILVEQGPSVHSQCCHGQAKPSLSEQEDNNCEIFSDGELHQQEQTLCRGHDVPAGQDSAGPGLYTGRQTGLMEED